jgi:hypothetical protein
MSLSTTYPHGGRMIDMLRFRTSSPHGLSSFGAARSQSRHCPEIRNATQGCAFLRRKGQHMPDWLTNVVTVFKCLLGRVPSRTAIICAFGLTLVAMILGSDLESAQKTELLSFILLPLIMIVIWAL